MQNHAVDPFGIVGQVLDAQFRVDRLVGEGGFSAVYRGHHLGLQEPIAIKCLKLPPSLSPALVDQFAKRFRDESRILYRLSQGNLNIVRSIAGGTWQANTGLCVPYMILEWMEGRSLANEFTIRRTVGQQGRTLEEVVKFFSSAADGLGYAHSQGVIHRDLNPGNLFLAATPQGVKLKVLDFGVAKILDDSTLNIARTQTVGQIRIFAPAYGSPEQFDDAIGKVGAASDVYSFALILLEALRDRCVNDGQHLGEFAQRAIDPNRRPTPRALGIEVSDEVELIFARATKLDPRERWQSAGELWQALAIAANAASEQKYAQAAMETPALGMPQPANVRTTQQGMAPPPKPVARMDKTMPIGAVMPNLNLPRPAVPLPSAPRVPVASPPSPRVGPPASAPRVPARPAAAADQPPTQRFPGDVTPSSQPEDHEEEMPTRIGASPPTDEPDDEPEDEVTCIRAPEPDVLRGLAEADARRLNNTTMTQVSVGTPRPAAGNPLPAAGTPPPAAGAATTTAPPPVPDIVPPSYGGTLMMAPGGFGPLPPPPAPSPPQQPQHPPSGQHLAATMMHGSPSHNMPGQAGAQHHLSQPQPQQQQHPQPQPPNPQHQQQQQHHQQPPMMQQQQHIPMQPQGPNPFGQPPQGHRMADSVSLPPASAAGVPKKGNTMLFVGLGVGALLIGAIGAGVVVMRGRGEVTGPVPSATVSVVPIVSAPPPPPTVDPTPPPVPVTADASVVADDVEVDAGIAPTPTTTTTATAATPTPTPTPTDVAPNPWPAPTPVAVKDAGPPPDPNAFSEATARSRLGQANGVLVFCKKEGGVTGPGTATVTFNTDGSVGAVTMDPPYAGTPAGDCVAGHFKRTKVSSFQGSAQTVRHSFEVPK